MATFIVLHIPHIIPAIVAMGFLGRFAAVMADQPPAEFSDAQIAEWRRVRIERARPAASAPRARAWACYRCRCSSWRWRPAVALHGRPARRPPVGTRHLAARHLQRVALALVTYKVAESGRNRLARGLDPARFLTDGLSLVLAALAVPLLVTGAVLIVAPGSSSATAYAHLIASTWWMTLFGVHIMRYLGRSLDATFHGKSAPD